MIRLACTGDLAAVDAIYDAILTLEEARPVSFTNWQRGKYPTLDHARRAMEEHTLWLAEEDGKYYAAMRVIPQPDPDEWTEAEYAYGKWLIRERPPVLTA